MEILYPQYKFLSLRVGYVLSGVGGAPVRWNIAILSTMIGFWDAISQACQNVDFAFNQSYKTTFYFMWFTRHMIVIN